METIELQGIELRPDRYFDVTVEAEAVTTQCECSSESGEQSVTEAWEEREDGSCRVDQIIYVMRDGHKGILLGKRGETIKAVSKASREELEEFLGRKVHLFLQVKVRPNWLDEAERYSEMGLDFKDGNA